MYTLYYAPGAASMCVHTALIEIGATHCNASWNSIDAHLRAHGPYLLGTQFSAADIFLTMLMRWSRHTPRQPIEWPALRSLAERVKKRPSWKRLYELEGLTEWV